MLVFVLLVTILPSFSSYVATLKNQLICTKLKLLITKILKDARQLLRAFLEFQYFYVSKPVIANFRLEKSIDFPDG